MTNVEWTERNGFVEAQSVRSAMSDRDPSVEYHGPGSSEPPPCVGQWCCGCSEHPIGKPWGWNTDAWDRHYIEVHPERLVAAVADDPPETK